MNDRLQRKIKSLPNSPGCYLMKQNEQIIYVGKAINLKNRVKSYFQKNSGHTIKVAAMVEKVDDFDIVLCDTNLEALILESNLIKLHMPYYNILLKDDKHYPYIRIDVKEPFPKLEIVRKIAQDGAKYFGPYIGATTVREAMDAVAEYFPLRNCSLRLPLKNKVRPCVNYEIGRCLGPCAQKCTQEEYGQVVNQAIDFLQGNYKGITQRLKKEMEEASALLAFEKAAKLRDQLNDVLKMMENQQAIQTQGEDQDIIGIAQDGLDAMVQVLWVRNGKMLGGQHYVLPREGAEPVKEVISGFILQYYKDGTDVPRHMYCQEVGEDETDLENYLRDLKKGAFTLHEPKRGEKKKLIALAVKNAKDALEKRNAKNTIAHERTIGASKLLGDIIGLKEPPRRIEGFDISNTQGALSVAAMVVFVDGVAAKKEYRHFRIKTVEGANDFESMKEVIGRRFVHGLQEKAEREQAGLPLEEGRFSWLPDVVLIDGGPQQLRFAMEAMKEAGAEVPMFGLAERIDEIYLPGMKLGEAIYLPRNSPALHLIQRVRDEAHRFGLTHHQSLRSKASIHSRLEEIEGIGPKRRKALLTHFKSLQKIKEATVEELLEVKGMNLVAAQGVYDWCREKK